MISGTLLQILPQGVVVDVAGVGYLVATPYTSNPTIGEKLTLHTYLAVRETALDLYGFQEQDELELFELLLTLPKIGPKSALQILAQANLPLLKTAILNNDPEHLSKMSGIGKKTAEKIVTGLKDRFTDIAVAEHQAENTHTTDAIDALVALGYPQSDARKIIQQQQNTHPHFSTNDLVREALKMLGSS